MAEYRQYCPVARASEILADRWTPLIVRELLAGSGHFNAIERGLPGISRSLLAERLRHLEDAGVVERRAGGRPNVSEYVLTEAGQELRAVIDRLGAWGVRWAFGDPRPEELDAALLVWKIHQRIDRGRLPPTRTVVEFDFRGRGARRVWLVLEPREVSVCLRPPRFETDVVVHAELLDVYRVWLGHVPWATAIGSGQVTIDGDPALVRALPGWLLWSPMAVHVREHQVACAVPSRPRRAPRRPAPPSPR
ncbi:MAG: helix-turn-helix domain-containing protein [Vicinamibacterales bacterium]